jgi:hypothetical protein
MDTGREANGAAGLRPFSRRRLINAQTLGDGLAFLTYKLS